MDENENQINEQDNKQELFLDLKIVGEIIKKARENYHLSLRELAGFINEDASNLSKIEKGELNVKLDRFIKIVSFLKIDFVHNSLSEKVSNNYDYIISNLGIKPINEIAKEISIDRSKLRKDLLLLVKLGKIEESKLTIIKNSLRKYQKEDDLINNLEIGGILKIKFKEKNTVFYLRQMLSIHKAKGKDFMSKTEDNILLIVRVK